MNGRTHAAIGAASVSGAAFVGVPLLDVGIMAAVAAGFALGPDIDHPGSTISRSMPKFVSRAACWSSRQVRQATSTIGDRADAAWKDRRGRSPDHRALTHTGLSVLFTSAFVWMAAHIQLAPVIIPLLCLWWCHDLIRPLWMSILVPAALFISIGSPLSPSLLAWSSGVGWLSHVAADGCTKDGVPFLWPVKVQGPTGMCVSDSGKRWWKIRILGTMLSSGDKKEWFPAIGVAIMLNLPIIFLA